MKRSRGLIFLAVLCTLGALLGACRGGKSGRWPEVNPGCQKVEVIMAGEPVSREYRVLEEIRGHWDEPDKDLRNWLVNKACALGADAVIEVIEAEGHDEDGPVWNIQGTAVVFQ